MMKLCGYSPLGFSEFGFSHSLGQRTFSYIVIVYAVASPTRRILLFDECCEERIPNH